MPFCKNCGMQFDDAGCRLCGTKPARIGIPKAKAETGEGIPPNMANALCYLLGPFTAMVFMAWSPHNSDRTVRFNALQSLLFFVFYLSILFSCGLLLPPDKRDIVGRSIQVTGVVCWLYVMWRTFQGDKVMIPLIGQVAEKNS